MLGSFMSTCTGKLWLCESRGRGLFTCTRRGGPALDWLEVERERFIIATRLLISRDVPDIGLRNLLVPATLGSGHHWITPNRYFLCYSYVLAAKRWKPRFHRCPGIYLYPIAAIVRRSCHGTVMLLTVSQISVNSQLHWSILHPLKSSFLLALWRKPTVLVLFLTLVTTHNLFLLRLGLLCLLLLCGRLKATDRSGVLRWLRVLLVLLLLGRGIQVGGTRRLGEPLVYDIQPCV